MARVARVSCVRAARGGSLCARFFSQRRGQVWTRGVHGTSSAEVSELGRASLAKSGARNRFGFGGGGAENKHLFHTRSTR